MDHQALSPSAPGGRDANRVALERIVLVPGARRQDDAAGRGERAVWVIAGEGEATLDGRSLRVDAGTTLRLPAGATFDLRNASLERDLVYVVAQAQGGPIAGAEGPLAPLANRLAWLLRRVARRLAR